MTSPVLIIDVFSVAEVARAAGVSTADAQALVEQGRIGTIGGFLATSEAVRAVRLLRGADTPIAEPPLFLPHRGPEGAPGRALIASGTLHAALLALIAVVTSMGLATAPHDASTPLAAMRLIFIPTPGPGGGGGGGGLHQPLPPARALMKGKDTLKSPVPPPRRITQARAKPEPIRRPAPPPRPVEHPVEPPPAPPAPAAMPQVVAPVAVLAADPQDRAGVLTDAAVTTESSGSGLGGGAGTGRGTGMGEGDGSGIGPGSGGGTGGGPYRPGSGIVAPGLLREVKPDYTEAARRRGIEGDVVLEIVVRSDGGVGTVRILQGLDPGLDQRAVEAVRQWRFSPARRLGSPVDVIVEIAVEFKLR